MYVSSFPSQIKSVMRPAVWALAQRLFVLTDDRPGSAKHKPTVASFYETGIVLSLYEHLLMSSYFSKYDIRYENAFKDDDGGQGAPKRVDLWLRPLKGGHPHFIEVGDFSVSKIHNDIRKMVQLNQTGKNWFVALFRKEDGAGNTAHGGESCADAKAIIERSLKRKNGLDPSLVGYDERLTDKFEVYRPNGDHDWFGVAILQAKR